MASFAGPSFCAKGSGVMSKKPRRATTATTAGNVPAPVKVRLRRITCDYARPYPPDGQAREWWQRLKNAFGTASSEFVDASLQQLITGARLPYSGISEVAVNASIAFIEGAKPQDEVECALVIQMACTHGAAMAVLRRLGGGHGFERNVAMMASAAGRLLRAYTAQVEALRRLRNGGSQRRIGVLMHLAADDPEGLSRVAAFLQGLQEAGWAVGRNVNIDVRWAAGEADRFRRYAAELLALTPDVIVASATPSVRAMHQATRIVPIVFVLLPDAVGIGIVDSLSGPGGNATGFTSTELGMSVNWLQLLKQIAPKITRAAVLRDPTDPASIGQFGAVKGAAPVFGVEINPIGVSSAEEIDRGITAFAREQNGGLIVLPVPMTVINRDLIIKLAAQHRLPAIYNSRYWVAEGGLVSYGADVLDQYRRTAGYVDRILKGRETGRPAGAGANQIRTGDQSQNREGTWP
jgi:putative ABC transport system substrate-binding protein